MSNKQLIYLCIYFVFSIIVFLSTDLPYLGQLSLIVFVLSLGLFLLTNMPAGLSAFMALIIGIVLGLPEKVLFESLNEQVVWLMIGAFIIGAAVEKSGLLDRLIYWINDKCRTKNKMNLFLFIIVQVISILVPSTSGRAAAMLPIYKAFSIRFQDNQKYFALLIPVLILMGANLTLIGAGSHIVGIGLLKGQTNENISYVEFLLWGGPFGIMIGIISLIIINKMNFNTNEINTQTTLNYLKRNRSAFSVKEQKTLLYLLITISLWITESIHGFDIAFITIVMSIVIVTPNVGVISWKEGLQSISWSLIFFVAGATSLGKLLVSYKVVQYIQEHLFGYLSRFENINVQVILLIIVIITVTSHLYVTSHTTRAVVFVPLFLLFSDMFNLNPVAVVFITLIGTNYCVTFPVSSKALLLFYEQENKPFENKDLAKISSILMPIYMLMMIACYYFWWQFTGLSLR
ncbi:MULTISPECIES: SLC13 family permease [Mammaliicoccus]|uniref:Anion permease n=1 Tax=Mammaliicoccus fleurettii TaxID=150056 RepID=A0ABS5MJ06_9STAP|nr:MULTISPECIES: SLC13 family permease [Mammaliicoccus]MBL0846864.1 anion permease [Mammaliicoccus fleurettii]MBS3670826.1 anion permease [Mammaliicoccus fleurettii]MBS3695885.1 anion permease [Mammaliicoccus fleurettii]MBW0764559.1 SLC13 family permease [Mammaliicoccus fleurettii]PTE33767.1 anion:sodium symporter [Mammaliicoccus fleurettii]